MEMTSISQGRFPHKIRGSVVTQRRRCGTPSCRCAEGIELHESTVLSYSEGGRNRTVMLAAQEIDLVLSLIHISEPTRRTPISYAVFCLKKKKTKNKTQNKIN